MLKFTFTSGMLFCECIDKQISDIDNKKVLLIVDNAYGYQLIFWKESIQILKSYVFACQCN